MTLFQKVQAVVAALTSIVALTAQATTVLGNLSNFPESA